jgi:hypothetical protein
MRTKEEVIQEIIRVSQEVKINKKTGQFNLKDQIKINNLFKIYKLVL